MRRAVNGGTHHPVPVLGRGGARNSGRKRAVASWVSQEVMGAKRQMNREL